jgi:isopentenyldiphosphate isomerase
MEILDVVDKDDKVIGQATREECHTNPKLMHRTVHFTLFDRTSKKILITLRSREAEHDALKLCFLGKHLKSKETYEEALARGVKEELGFTPKGNTEVGRTIFSYDKQTEFVRFFLIFWNGEKINPDPVAIEEFKWTTAKNLYKNRSRLSEISRFWVENIGWEDIFR